LRRKQKKKRASALSRAQSAKKKNGGGGPEWRGGRGLRESESEKNGVEGQEAENDTNLPEDYKRLQRGQEEVPLDGHNPVEKTQKNGH